MYSVDLRKFLDTSHRFVQYIFKQKWLETTLSYSEFLKMTRLRSIEDNSYHF